MRLYFVPYFTLIMLSAYKLDAINAGFHDYEADKPMKKCQTFIMCSDKFYIIIKQI